MDFNKALIINRLIMALLESKYPDVGPGCFTPPDERYYRQLSLATKMAEAVLGNEAPSTEWIKGFIKHCYDMIEARTAKSKNENRRSTKKVPQKV